MITTGESVASIVRPALEGDCTAVKVSLIREISISDAVALTQNALHNLSLDVSQPKVAALVAKCEPLVIDAEQVQHGSVQIMHVDNVFDRSVAQFVGRAVRVAAADAKDPLKTAQAFATEANMSAADMVKETAFVKPGDDVPNIGISPQFEEGIGPLVNVGDVGEKTPIQNGFAIPMLAEVKPPRGAEFEEVKAQIVDVVKLEKARAQVEEIAKQIAAGAASASALGAAAKSKGMTSKEQKNLILGSPLGEGPTAGTSEALQDAIYAMKVGDVTKTPIKVGDNWYVVGVTKREDAKTDDFAKQRSGLIESMLSKKRSAVFSDYLAATKQKLEAGGYIKVYKGALDKIDAPVPGLVPAVPVS